MKQLMVSTMSNDKSYHLLHTCVSRRHSELSNVFLSSTRTQSDSLKYACVAYNKANGIMYTCCLMIQG